MIYHNAYLGLGGVRPRGVLFEPDREDEVEGEVRPLYTGLRDLDLYLGDCDTGGVRGPVAPRPLGLGVLGPLGGPRLSLK